MTARTLRTLTVALLLGCYSGAALAKDANAVHRCQSGIKQPGQPHAIETLAQINAIKNWTTMAKKHGEDYAQWLYAKGSSIECTKIGKAGMFLCHASAKPCLPPEDLRSSRQGGASAKASVSGS